VLAEVKEAEVTPIALYLLMSFYKNSEVVPNPFSPSITSFISPSPKTGLSYTAATACRCLAYILALSRMLFQKSAGKSFISSFLVSDDPT
jgi:hypothetical protein